MAKVIGIDLGTTNSVAAVVEGGKPKVIHSAEGENTTPSVVEPEKNLVGRLAKRQQVVNPHNTVFSVKRLMGRKMSDKEVSAEKDYLPYDIVEGKNGMVVVEINGKKYTPQEIASRILAKIKTDAESYLGGKVAQAVITVPAYFDDAQRQATKQAGEIAGLEVVRIINEPTAAVLAYGLDKNANQKVAIYDLGGGTFDISILEIEAGGQGEDDRNIYQVVATAGDTHLGGDDFDKKLVDHVVTEFKKEQGVDLTKDRQAMQRVRDAAEKAKIELSQKGEAEVNIPYITADDTGPKHLLLTISRAELEHLTQDLIERTFTSVSSALKDANLTAKDIDEVILVGGQTRMPLVRERVKEYFGKDPHKGVNPDEVVAMGAALQGGVLTGEAKDVLLLDVTPLTLGIETLGGVRTPLIDRNTTIPTSKSQIFSTAADNQTSVEVNVLQGEREMALDNKSLGRFILEGIPPAPRGMPQVEVTFDIDSNGILKVTAKDKATGKEQKITITGSTGLDKDEVSSLVQEAKAHEAEDQAKKEAVEARNNAEALIFSAEKALQEAGDKVSGEIKSKVEEKISALKEVLKTAAVAELKTKTEALAKVLQEVGAALYSQPETKEAPSDDSATNNTGEVSEGEVVEE